jgi:hypothetical protein
MNRRETTGPPADVLKNGLPTAIESEAVILGSLINGSASVEEVSHVLTSSDFSLEHHRRVFACMTALHERGSGIDRLLVIDELKKRRQLTGVGGVSFVANLDEGLPRVRSIKGHVEVVKRMSTLRCIIGANAAMTERAIEKDDPGVILSTGVENLRKLQHDNGEPAEAPPAIRWPQRMGEEGFYGPVGELIRRLAPHTEADPHALLFQALAGLGNLVSRGPFMIADGARHYTNLFVGIVGSTSKGRKGTSWARIRGVLECVDEHWTRNCLLSGIGSGEALVDCLGKDDHRRLLLEFEFARLLNVMDREGTTLSSIFRQLWDSGECHVIVRANETHVTDAHLSVVGHITKDELLAKLSETDVFSGFANRMLWCCAKRSQELPFGGGSIDFGDVPSQLREASHFVRRLGNTRVDFDSEAHEMWPAIYHELTKAVPGLFGAIVARADPQVLRLALNFALLDCSNQIGPQHLQAALAVWRYSEASVQFIWGNLLGDATADEMLGALRDAGDAGRTRWDLSVHFARNKSAKELDRALGVLEERGLIRSKEEPTAGRPRTRYWAL